MVKTPRRLIQVDPVTPEFKAAMASGRVALYALNLQGGIMIYIYVLYGYTGGEQNKRQAARTAKLARAIETEIATQPGAPTVIVGDFNNEPMNIPAFKGSWWTSSGQT